MPQPAYIFCSALTADDPLSGSVSCLHLLETLQQFQPQQTAVLQRIPVPIGMARIVGTWMKSNEADSDTRFEVQNVLVLPGGTEHVVGHAEFIFGENSFHRILSPFFIPAGLQPGILYIESRLRRMGDDAWLLRQRYPILVQSAPSPNSKPSSEQQATG